MLTAKRISRSPWNIPGGPQAGVPGGLPKRLTLVLALMALAGGLHAQEQRFWSLDFGLASNNILVDGVSFGFVLDPRIGLSPRFMLGNKNQINFSPEGDEIMIVSLETQAYLRWNFFRFGDEKINTVFLQGGVGLMVAYRGDDVQMTRGSVLCDVTLGINIPISDRWHIEPSVRAGYPFIMGASITAGKRFPIRQQAMTRAEYIGIIRELPPVEVIRELPPIEIIKRIIITQVEYVLFGPDIGVYNEGVDRDAMALNNLVIDAVANTLHENSSLVVRIEGHANPVTLEPGEIEELLELSEKRANEVARRLREKGVAEEQIVVAAFGGTRTLTGDHDHWNIKRRVELIVKQIDLD